MPIINSTYNITYIQLYRTTIIIINKVFIFHLKNVLFLQYFMKAQKLKSC